MYINQLKRAVRPLTNRIHLNTALKTLAWSLAVAGLATLILYALSLFLPVTFLLKKTLLIYTLCAGTAITASLFLRPGLSKTFQTADSLGLKERLITAWELKDDAAPLAQAQKADALSIAIAADFSSLYPIRFPFKLLSAAIGLLLAASLLTIIPSPAREQAVKTEKLKGEIAEQVENLKKEQQELNKKQEVSEEKLKELNQKIDEMLKELQKSDTEEEALKALAKSKNELEELKEAPVDEDLKKLAEQLENNTETKELSDALKSGNMEDIKQKLEDLKRKTATMEDSEKGQLAQDLKEASEQAKNNPQLSQNLSDLSQALSSGNQTNTNQAMSDLEQSLSAITGSSQQSAQAMDEALQDMMASISNAKQQISDLDPSGSQLAQADDSQQSGESPGDSGGQGGSQNGQQGNNGGQGSDAQGMGGNGAGTGTSNKDAGYSDDETGGASRSPGEKQITDYEKIYIPDRLGGDADPSQVKGQKGSAGQSHWTDSNAPVENGDILPYSSVLGEYKNEAMRGLQDSAIPAGMKELVRDYFTSLE